MDFLKELFDNGPLNWDAFKKAVNDKAFKLANLATGEYVSVSKYDTDIQAKNTTIETLNNTLATRDDDLKTLNKQLEEAGASKETIETLKTNLSNLQIKYDEDTEAFKKEIAKQNYLAKAKDVASGEQFSSNAAKQMFINALVEKDLKIDGDKLLGADEFITSYKEQNADSFVTEISKPPVQQFTDKTDSNINKEANPFMSAFNFTGIRKAPGEN